MRTVITIAAAAIATVATTATAVAAPAPQVAPNGGRNAIVVEKSTIAPPMPKLTAKATATPIPVTIASRNGAICANTDAAPGTWVSAMTFYKDGGTTVKTITTKTRNTKACVTINYARTNYRAGVIPLYLTFKAKTDKNYVTQVVNVPVKTQARITNERINATHGLPGGQVLTTISGRVERYAPETGRYVPSALSSIQLQRYTGFTWAAMPITNTATTTGNFVFSLALDADEASQVFRLQKLVGAFTTAATSRALSAEMLTNI